VTQKILSPPVGGKEKKEALLKKIPLLLLNIFGISRSEFPFIKGEREGNIWDVDVSIVSVWFFAGKPHYTWEDVFVVKGRVWGDYASVKFRI